MNLKSYSSALAIILATTNPTLTTCFITPNNKISTNQNPFPRLKPAFGILDEVNSDSFNLQGSSSNPSSGDGGKPRPTKEDAFEILLAEIVFSSNDPRVDIIDNFDRCSDPEWIEWLNKKIETSTDPEEKVALRDLYSMLEDILRKMEVSKLAEEGDGKESVEEVVAEDVEEDNVAGASMSDTDVLRKAASVTAEPSQNENTKSAPKSFIESELTPEIRLSYEDMCKKVLPPYKPGDTPSSIAFTFYDQFDAQFVKVLKERSENGDTDSQAVLDALAEEQQKRLSSATDNLKSVLALGDPNRMEGMIVKLAREGKIDEPFLLLLEANAKQAEMAGATGPAQLMRKLKERGEVEKDKQATSKEVKLLRQLLRTDDVAQREVLLEDAFTPKDTLIVSGTASNAQKAFDGELPDEDQEKPMPEVPPPDFINACKAVLLNFGNLSADDDERGDLATRIKVIASEAEVVATRIYGKGMSSKEQQDRAWKDQTTSIFDLETMEIEAERMGSKAPWANENDDDILPGFDASGKMRVGGS